MFFWCYSGIRLLSGCCCLYLSMLFILVFISVLYIDFISVFCIFLYEFLLTSNFVNSLKIKILGISKKIHYINNVSYITTNPNKTGRPPDTYITSSYWLSLKIFLLFHELFRPSRFTSILLNHMVLSKSRKVKPLYLFYWRLKPKGV